MRISKRRVVSAAVVAVVAVIGTASVAGAAPPPKFQLVVFDESPPPDIHFSVVPVPEEIEPVNVKVGLANNSIAPHVLVPVGGLPASITVPEFIELLDAVAAGAPPPEGSFSPGGPNFVKPGQDHQKQLDLTTPGRYGFFCPITSPDGTPHYKEGFVGLFNVVEPAS